MAKYVIDGSTLEGLANAIRGINGETKSYTPDEMIERVTNILDSVTYILVDETGNQIPALYTEGALSLTATPNDIRIGTTAVTEAGITEGALSLTATPNDIRIGTTAVTEAGITEGEKEIPAYYVNEGCKVITNGSKCVLPIPDYDYKKLQAVFCVFNTNLSDSVSSDRVALNDNVYPVNSTTAETTITKDHSNTRVDFGITNTSGKLYLIRYFCYTEVY